MALFRFSERLDVQGFRDDPVMPLKRWLYLDPEHRVLRSLVYLYTWQEKRNWLYGLNKRYTNLSWEDVNFLVSKGILRTLRKYGQTYLFLTPTGRKVVEKLIQENFLGARELYEKWRPRTKQEYTKGVTMSRRKAYIIVEKTPGGMYRVYIETRGYRIEPGLTDITEDKSIKTAVKLVGEYPTKEEALEKAEEAKKKLQEIGLWPIVKKK